MNHGFGHEVPPRHTHQQYRQVTRYLIVIDAADRPVARLFQADRTQVAEFDAGTEEVVELIKTASASTGAGGAEWDKALAGHTADERAKAIVYELEL